MHTDKFVYLGHNYGVYSYSFKLEPSPLADEPVGNARLDRALLHGRRLRIKPHEAQRLIIGVLLSQTLPRVVQENVCKVLMAERRKAEEALHAVHTERMMQLLENRDAPRP